MIDQSNHFGVTTLRRLIAWLSPFHHAEDSENFGRKSNEKVRFGFFRPVNSELPMEKVHLDRSDQNLPLRCREFGWQEPFLLVGPI